MNQDTAAPSTLYEAAVGFMVSEKSASNSWDQVAQFVTGFYNARVGEDTPTILKQLKQEFRIVERQVKADFGVSKLPVAWRTAKSTALNAVKSGVPIVKDGAALPKTDVGKVLKHLKKGTVTPDQLTHFRELIDQAMAVYGFLNATDRMDAALYLVRSPLYGIPHAPMPVAAAASSSS